MAKELTEDRGDLLTPLAPLPLPVTGPLMVPFPLPPFDQKDNNTYQFLDYQKCQFANPKKQKLDTKANAIKTAQLQLQCLFTYK